MQATPSPPCTARHPLRALLFLPALTLLLGLAAALPGTAAASPWLLPRGDVALVLGFSARQADEEFLDDAGSSQAYPLRGKFNASDLYVGARFGLTERWELALGLPLRQISYTADTVILLEAPEGLDSAQTAAFYRANTLDFSSTQVGLGDLTLAGRYRLWAGRYPAAAEIKLKSPTGYAAPSGTFGDRPKTVAAFLDAATDPDAIKEVVKQEQVADDVTLGDGQLDLSLSLLNGFSFPTGTFARTDIGYNLRMGGAGDEILLGLKGGQTVTPQLLVYGGGQFTYAVQEGRVAGISVAATDPDLPARQYSGLSNLAPREWRLSHDWLELTGGVILRIIEGAEVNIAYAHTVWGRNTGRFHSLFFSVGTRFSTLGDG